MKEEELNRLRKKLLALEEEVSGYLAKSEESAAAIEPDKGLGRLSRMEAMQDQQMVLELRRRKKRQRLEIANAISRIDKGSYGKCSFCGREIALDRLNAFPEVQTCVTCA
jgi:DnaK suppressor protein